MAELSGRQKDPLKRFKFRVEIDGITVAGFNKVSGLKDNTEVVEYREGTDPATPRKVSGLSNHDNIILDRGLSADVTELAEWREEVMKYDGTDGGPPEEMRKNVRIQILSKDGKRVEKTYTLLHAWPIMH